MAQVPDTIHLLVQAIRKNGGQPRADTLVRIAVARVPYVRSHLNDIHAALGRDSPGPAALNGLIQATEDALNPTRPPVTRQHFLSQTMMKRWLELKTSGNVLTRFDFVTRIPNDIGTYGVGYVNDFVAIDSAAIEQVWSTTEQHITRAVDAAIAKTALGGAGHESILRKTVALHFARHPLIYENHESTWAKEYPESIDRLEASGLGDVGFRELTGGLIPAGPEARRIGAERMREPFKDLHDTGALFRFSIERLYDNVCDRFDQRTVAIWTPSNPYKEFLIGDVPAIPRLHATNAAGMDEGVGAENADDIVMPLGPRITIVLGATGYRDLSDAEVDELNELQVRKATQFVHYRPSANFIADFATWRP